MVKTLEDLRENPQEPQERRLHLHFFASPKEILGEDGKVVGFRVEKTKLDGTGNVTLTGETADYPVQAVYRAVGYFGSPLDEIPFDAKYGVINNDEGQVLDDEGNHIPGIFCTGWIKRGPVGLIGHTKADAIETISHVIANRDSWWQPTKPSEQAILETLSARGVEFVQWDNWLNIDDAEKSLGQALGRERLKLFERAEMLQVSKGE